MLGAPAGEGDWSAPVDGLSGRLRVWLEDLRPGFRHAVYLELWNHSLATIGVTNQPRVDAGLWTGGSVPVPPAAVLASGPVHAAQAALIPGGAYLGFRIDMQTVGLPMREPPAALVALGGRSWVVGAGRYRLAATIAFPASEAHPASDWAGELNLPPADFDLNLEGAKR